MAEHSPTPWRVIDLLGAKDEICQQLILARDCSIVAEYVLRNADAHLIVEAVNERDRLREELAAAKDHAESEERWANDYFEQAQKAEAERDRLRDLIRRLADVVRHECTEEGMALTREAYAALGEEVPR